MPSEKQNKQRTTWPIPDDAWRWLLKANARSSLRDVYANIPFCYKFAVRASEEQLEFISKFWDIMNTRFPELRHSVAEASLVERVVMLKEDK